VAPSDPRHRPGRPSALLLGGGLVAVIVIALAAGGGGASDDDRPSPPPAAAASSSPPAPTPVALDPAWPRRLTMISDSVGLGSITAMRETMAEWRVRVLGRPALMLDDAASQLRKGGALDRVMVVALGYNSLWRRDGTDHDYYAAKFDEEAEALLRVLRAQGVRKVVWVTLREASREHIPADALDQHATYAWYFPWVNERLRRLDRRHDDVVLADWSAVSDRRGITYDAFHLDPDGALLYARTIRDAVLEGEILPG
jgi:hypothetical protein